MRDDGGVAGALEAKDAVHVKESPAEILRAERERRDRC